MLHFAWKVLVPASLANLLWVAIVIKLPLGDGRALSPLQYVLLIAGSLAILVVVVTLLGRAAKQYVAKQEAARMDAGSRAAVAA
jgi:hypothetical protein